MLLPQPANTHNLEPAHSHCLVCKIISNYRFFPLSFRWIYFMTSRKLFPLLFVSVCWPVSLLPHLVSTCMHQFYDSFIIWLTFEWLQCARHCSSHWRYISAQKRKTKNPGLMEVLFGGGPSMNKSKLSEPRVWQKVKCALKEKIKAGTGAWW